MLDPTLGNIILYALMGITGLLGTTGCLLWWMGMSKPMPRCMVEREVEEQLQRLFPEEERKEAA